MYADQNYAVRSSPSETDRLRALTQEQADEIAELRRQLGQQRDEDFTSALRRRWGLTGKEAGFVTALYQRAGSVVTKDGLMISLYGMSDDEPVMKIVDVFACKVRGKMGQGYIVTHWGRGYSLSPEAVQECARLATCSLASITPAPPPPPRKPPPAVPFFAKVLACVRDAGAGGVDDIRARFPAELHDQVRGALTMSAHRGLLLHRGKRYQRVYSLSAKGAALLTARGL